MTEGGDGAKREQTCDKPLGDFQVAAGRLGVVQTTKDEADRDELSLLPLREQAFSTQSFNALANQISKIPIFTTNRIQHLPCVKT
jgi:hypothetical protein